MGWRGTLRTINAAARANAREAERRRKHEAKTAQAREAAEAVSVWEDHLNRMTSIHQDTAHLIDWVAMKNEPRPQEPQRLFTHSDAARARLQRFRPGFISRRLGLAGRKTEKLAKACEQAECDDEAAYQAKRAEYQRQLSEWEESQSLSRRVLALEPSAIMEALNELGVLSDDHRLGRRVTVSLRDVHPHIIAAVHDEDIIPSFRRKQLASAKLSETAMPKAEFYALYQDYVVSVALRCAGDMLASLPVDQVFVTCLAEQLDTATGYRRDQPILSVRVMRETFNRLNLAQIDPSDSLKNFVHNISFGRTKGFAPILPLAPLPDE